MDFQEDIERCLETLRKGGLILYPTDTIWGIGCDATNSESVQKIFALKNRPESKSMIVLLADERDILKYASQADLKVFDFLKTVKKPTTVIYEGAIDLAVNLISEDGSIAIRLVKEEFCKHIIKRFRKPIVSTSANISGNPSPKYFLDIKDEIIAGVDYVVRYRQDDNTIREPSALVKWHRDGRPIYLRN